MIFFFVYLRNDVIHVEIQNLGMKNILFLDNVNKGNGAVSKK